MQEQQNNRRHSEKTRVASCPFADAIASTTLEHYRACCPPDLLLAKKQTVVAAFVVAEVNEGSLEQNGPKLSVVALGMGTKFLSTAACGADTGGTCVRDMHAEVIARRGFLRYLYCCVSSLLDENSSGVFPNVLCHRGAEICQKPNFFVHFYSSAQPCGNATEKKWGVGSTPTHLQDQVALSPSDHPQLHIVARDAGQVALQVKAPVETTTNSSQLEGTASCSDKIAKWNVVGLQGTLLSSILSHPLHMKTITIGHKFSELHCRRALCCRVDLTKQLLCRKEKRARDESASPPEVNHPLILCTAIKLDASIRGTGDEPADFSEHRCFVWWRNESLGGVGEVLDGKSGKLSSSCDSTNQPSSSICKASLMSCFLALKCCNVKSSGMSYDELKRSLNLGWSGPYATAKHRLLSDPLLFARWPVGPGAPALKISSCLQ